MNLPKIEFEEEQLKLYARQAFINAKGKDFLVKNNPIKQVYIFILNIKYSNKQDSSIT